MAGQLTKRKIGGLDVSCMGLGLMGERLLLPACRPVWFRCCAAAAVAAVLLLLLLLLSREVHCFI